MSWPQEDAPGVLVGLWLRQARGLDVTPPQVAPHLQAAHWRFVCECGVTWAATDSARVLDNRVVPPRRQCVVCGCWATGHVIPT